MSTDSEQRVSHTADKELQDIEKKYPGFIHMKLMEGIRLSYQLQHVLPRQQADGPLRGFRVKEGEIPSALDGYLYSCLRTTKASRRSILMMLLKQFSEKNILVHTKNTADCIFDTYSPCNFSFYMK